MTPLQRMILARCFQLGMTPERAQLIAIPPQPIELPKEEPPKRSHKAKPRSTEQEVIERG